MNQRQILELGRILDENPAKVLEILRADKALREEIEGYVREKMVGKKPSVDNFKVLYESFFGRELPRIDIEVAEEFIAALSNRTGVIFESWRGRGKSTFFAAWCPSVMGWNPVGSTTLMRVNTQKAQEMGKLIAALIMTNTGWKKHFAHVVPDEKAGWSVENGYNVMDTRVTGVPGSAGFEENYAKWRMACMADHLSEQSLLCVGIESGMGIGLHPTNGYWFDDLHDEKNTGSVAELKNVTDIVKKNIIPAWNSIGKPPTLGVFCTPWSENPPDAYQVFLATGMFKHIKMPLFRFDDDGEEIPRVADNGYNVPPEYAGRRVKLAWPERYDMQEILKLMQTDGTTFGQMRLCDVSLSQPKNIRFQTFPHNELRWNEWPQVVGVDPVSWVRGVSKGGGISHFAASQFLITPYNNVVIGDGFLERIDVIEGEERLAQIQRTYEKLRNFSIESNGAGATFTGMITRFSKKLIHSHTTGEAGAGGKKKRQYDLLSPLFLCGAILVSDEDTPYMNLVREYLNVFPNFEDGSKFEDLGDSLVMAVLDIPQLWTKIVVHDTDIQRQNIFKRSTTTTSPWASLGNWSR